MIPAALLEKADQRLITIDRSARLIAAAQAFDRPETRLMVVVDAAGAMVGVVSRTDIVAR
uniref:CBS domain-containing protein n=1 Tax=Phaeovulum sp. TaxID=2934796 RepID=UPI003561D918